VFKEEGSHSRCVWLQAVPGAPKAEGALLEKALLKALRCNQAHECEEWCIVACCLLHTRIAALFQHNVSGVCECVARTNGTMLSKACAPVTRCQGLSAWEDDRRVSGCHVIWHNSS
jgi:hypothetical protein